MPADNPTCESCRWFVEMDRHGREAMGIERIGLCYVRPPALANGARPMSLPRDFCGEHAPRVVVPRGGKPIVDSEMRIYDLASFRACAIERGVTLTGDPLPGDGFVFGSTSYIYDPESPDAPR